MAERNTSDSPGVVGFDHVAITVADIDATCRFYERTLGAQIENDYKSNGMTLVRRVCIGGAILNIHQRGNGLELVARAPTPGSADLCFRWRGGIERAIAQLKRAGVTLRDGPVPRVSNDGLEGRSVYFDDPDGNLIELLSA